MKKPIVLCLILSFIAIAVIAVCLLIPKNNMTVSKADNDTCTITTSSDSIKKGQDFTIQIAIKTAEPMQHLTAHLAFDNTLAEYTGKQDLVTGASGDFVLEDTFKEATSSKTYTLKFSALETGSCHFSLSNINFERFKDLSVVSLGEATANKKLDKDCTLSELAIAVGTMKEKWNPETYEYHITVPKDTELFPYSAVPSCEAATVASEGPEQLKDGINVFTITVTAPSGDSADYTLYVTR